MEKNIRHSSKNQDNEIKSEFGVYKTAGEISLEKLEYHIPPRELFSYCREKLKQLTNDYHDLLEKVQKWQSSCNLNFKLEQELQHRSCEVQRLQQTVSDLQVCVQSEREQVLHLHAENDRLQMQIVEDRKRIDLLMNLNEIHEHEIMYIMNNTSTGSIPVPRIFTKAKGGINSKKETDKDATKVIEQLDNQDIMHMECLTLRRELEQHIRLHHEQVSTLLKDRDLMQKEWDKEYTKLHNQISKLSNRLKDSDDRLCDATKELITIKKETANKEFGWYVEREKILQHIEHYQEQLSEKYPPTLGVAVSGNGKSNKQISAQISALKIELHEQEDLVSSYQEKCTMLEQEAEKHKVRLENTKSEYRDQMQKLKGQVTYLKKKYEELDRRRKLEAEGFYNDVKILRKRLQNIEKMVHKFCLKHMQIRTITTENSIHHNPPQAEQLYSTAQETTAKSQELEREVKNIMKRVREIESGLKDHVN